MVTVILHVWPSLPKSPEVGGEQRPQVEAGPRPCVPQGADQRPLPHYHIIYTRSGGSTKELEQEDEINNNKTVVSLGTCPERAETAEWRWLPLLDAGGSAASGEGGGWGRLPWGQRHCGYIW